MALVVLAYPDSEAEILTTVALLEAHGIPCHVRGGGFGGLLPGPQIPAYNAKAILVPQESLADARELLAARPDEFPAEMVEGNFENRPVSPAKSKLRMIAEFLIFGWFVPGSRSSTKR